jgi:hypothetical protein
LIEWKRSQKHWYIIEKLIIFLFEREQEQISDAERHHKTRRLPTSQKHSTFHHQQRFNRAKRSQSAHNRSVFLYTIALLSEYRWLVRAYQLGFGAQDKREIFVFKKILNNLIKKLFLLLSIAISDMVDYS